MKNVQLYLNYAGHCLAKEHHAIQGGRNETIKFHALFGLIRHPEKGWILYDTGYTTRFYDATKKYPDKIYAKATKVVITPEEEIKSQLIKFGITAGDIQHIILTHFHADHTAGLKDFPNAKIYCSRKAWQQAKEISSVLGFSRGILKKLHPADLESRIILVENCGERKEDETFGHKYDLFQDDSIYVYDLPGHAAGQIGIQLATGKKKYFLVADACWIHRSYRENILPHPIVKLFFHSWKDFKTSLHKINRFHHQNPDVIIVPTHCSETTDALISAKADMYAL